MLPTQKFSGFADGGDAQVGDTIVGLRGGINTRFTYPNGLPAGTILPISQGGTGANNVTDARINLGLGSMATQDASSVAITGGTATFGSASVNDAPVANIDIANKLYVDSQISGNLANYVTLATAQNITGAKTFQADLSMDSNFITNLADPVNPQDAATKDYVDDLIGSSFASGTRMVFQQTSAPTGWTKDTTAAINNGALRTVTGAVSSGGTVDFTTAFESKSVIGTVGNTTLSLSQIPAHTHTQTEYSLNIGSGSIPNSARATPFNPNTGSAGGGGSHNHTFTGTAINLAVKYYDVIIATKD